ncbi:phosphoserine aminotransferase-like [Planoprotostelium fungivorum]|uniref:Phosphoserine aminotransferase n=1 Tax=Planoprotostelium fungivorum TaxID=1890364 RepID=A0A2P6NPD9_9EUKA|nr:phosphoserine aminotransferase-like [Planoprotostelium fungivorum]
MGQDRVYNFAAGPACIPENVLKQAQEELLNYRGSGRSVLELSHRSKLFEGILADAQSSLRKLLNIPDNYKILFFQGGGTGQFAAVPLNLMGLSPSKSADYIVTGNWSQKAAEEAAKYGKVNIVCDTKATKYTEVPSRDQWKLNPDASYVYYCANETVYGVEFQEQFDSTIPIVCDASSNFLSRQLDVSKLGVLYAGAQKNSGTSGVTVVIIREDLIKTPLPETPTVLSYKIFAENNSLYNTPPTYPIYIAQLVYRWLLDLGGLPEMERINVEKSKAVYDVIDSSDFYRCPVKKDSRSRMNVVFRLPDTDLEKKFLEEAGKRNMVELNGHRSVGGIRVSLYNSMPLEPTNMLADFMREFMDKHKRE